MSPTEIEREALDRIRQIVKDELTKPTSAQSVKRISSALRDIAFHAQVAAQEIEEAAE